MDYLAYGSHRDLKIPAGSEGTRQKFTGKEFEDTTGLYAFGARWMDPELGMFTSPDPAGQFFNPYSYTGGNPIGMTDPDGMYARDGGGQSGCSGGCGGPGSGSGAYPPTQGGALPGGGSYYYQTGTSVIHISMSDPGVTPGSGQSGMPLGAGAHQGGGYASTGGGALGGYAGGMGPGAGGYAGGFGPGSPTSFGGFGSSGASSFSSGLPGQMAAALLTDYQNAVSTVRSTGMEWMLEGGGTLGPDGWIPFKDPLLWAAGFGVNTFGNLFPTSPGESALAGLFWGIPFARAARIEVATVEGVGVEVGSVGAMRVPKFEPAPYHTNVQLGMKNPGPANGQGALERSLQLKDTSPRRISIDDEGQFAIFDRTSESVYHGHIRSWKELTSEMQSVFQKSFGVGRKGQLPVGY